MNDTKRTKAEQMLAELRSQGFGGVVLADELEKAVTVLGRC